MATILATTFTIGAAQGFPVWQVTSPVPGDGFGSAVAMMGDVNGDGVPDIAVGAPGNSLPPLFPVPPTYAVILSGADGSLLHAFSGTSGGDGFGRAVAEVGDLDGDGVSDLAVGAPSGVGYVRVVSGATGATIRTFTLPVSSFLGASIAPAGFVDGDSVPDVLVGAPGVLNPNFSSGQAFIFSGATGAIIRTFTPASTVSFLGASVATIGDVDGDNFPDVVAGAPSDFTPLNQSPGNAIVFSGATGVQLYVMTGTVAGDRFGTSAAALGDVNLDGVTDMVIGASSSPQITGFPPARAEVRSGSNGALLFTLNGAFPGDLFGVSVANAGDVDGDGRADIVVGAPSVVGYNTGNTYGRVTVFSSATGAPLVTWAGATSNGVLGASVAGGRDLNGDGVSDFVAGAPVGSCFLCVPPPGLVMTLSAIGVGPGLVRYGAACGGTGGFAPSIAASGGAPVVGNQTFGFAVTHGLGGAPAFLFASAASAPSGFPIGGGCSAWLGAPFFQLGPALVLSGPAGAAAAGHAVIPVSIPSNPTLSGLSFYFEWALLDSGGSTGVVTTSDALAVTIF